VQLARRSFIGAALTTAIFPSSAAFAEQSGLANGIDVSWLAQYEAAGGVFRNKAGKTIDAFRFLKENGIKLVRLRLFVDAMDRNGSLADTLNLAQRAAKAGIQVALDFHFSDTWADPAHQTMPAGWQGRSLSELLYTLPAYVTSIAKKLKSRNVSPAFVQVGNEIANGMLWPIGRISGDSANEWWQLSSLFNAASDAVRQSFPKAKVVLHLELGGDSQKLDWWLKNAKRFDFDFDVVGLSYYPQWHGDLSRLRSSLRVAAVVHRKLVLVAETAYPWRQLQRSSDVLGSAAAILPGFPATKSGQSNYIRAVTAAVKSLPSKRGIGVWWWEGLANDVLVGSQVVWSEGMSNTSLIDDSGRAIPALYVLGH